MYQVYIILCGDNTLYTGITNNLEHRFQLHQAGKASRYTRARKAIKIMYSETCANRSAALKREAAIKHLSRQAKLKLLST